jgi:hypothetical protein
MLAWELAFGAKSEEIALAPVACLFQSLYCPPQQIRLTTGPSAFFVTALRTFTFSVDLGTIADVLSYFEFACRMESNPGMSFGAENLVGLHLGSIFTGFEYFLALVC